MIMYSQKKIMKKTYCSCNLLIFLKKPMHDNNMFKIISVWFNANISGILVILGVYHYLWKEHDSYIKKKERKNEPWLSKCIWGLLLACAVLPGDELDKEVSWCFEYNLYCWQYGLEKMEIWRGTGWIMGCTELAVLFFSFMWELFNIEKL